MENKSLAELAFEYEQNIKTLEKQLKEAHKGHRDSEYYRKIVILEDMLRETKITRDNLRNYYK